MAGAGRRLVAATQVLEDRARAQAARLRMHMAQELWRQGEGDAAERIIPANHPHFGHDGHIR